MGDVMPDEDFFTFREYMKKEGGLLTASMEDYLEMICRLSENTGFTRIHDLAAALNVQPPSATRMVQKLADAGLINYEKYGVILLGVKGRQVGNTLLKRHNIVESFLKLLGVAEGVLEETEKIEHTISAQTLKCMNALVNFLQDHPEIAREFEEYRNKNGRDM